MPRKQQADASTILRIGIVASVVAGGLALGAWALGVPVPEPGRNSGLEVDEPATAMLRDDPRVTVLGEMAGGIRESSGIAVSRHHDGVAWTHNDQGRRAQIFAISYDGTLRSTITLEGAELTDWEDIDLGKCPAGDSGAADCLYIGDIGDNSENRSSYSIVILPEPDPSQAASSARVATRLAFRYPEGPADTEAMAVTAQGDILLVTKGTKGAATLYRIPAARVTHGESGAAQQRIIDAERVGALPIDVSTRSRRITGAAVSPDGSTLAVRNFFSIYLFDLARPLALPRLCEFGRRQPQGEALDFLDDATFILTTERVAGQAPILRVQCEMGT